MTPCGPGRLWTRSGRASRLAYWMPGRVVACCMGCQSASRILSIALTNLRDTARRFTPGIAPNGMARPRPCRVPRVLLSSAKPLRPSSPIAIPALRAFPTILPARRADPLPALQREGRPSERLMGRLGIPASDTTILRSVREGAPSRGKHIHVRIAGVDEWAWRKGFNYGTIVVDLEWRQVVDLLA